MACGGWARAGSIGYRMPPETHVAYAYTVQHVRCGACGHPVTAVSDAALFAGIVEHQEVCKRG